VIAASFLVACASSAPPDSPPPSAPTAAPPKTAAPTLDIPELVRQAEPSVVTVLAGNGVGSGIVYKDDGTIVTNAHVVADAR
jgi:S1-C subfamily serine protease